MNNLNIALATTNPQVTIGDSYLKFHLNQQTLAVLALKHIQEAVVVPMHLLTPMPNMPDCIMGLMNWRSRIFWAIDLPGMLSLPALHTHQRQHNVIVISTESVLLGLVVQSIQGITRILTDNIESPVGQVPSGLVPYLRGCVLQDKEIALVLDAPAIVHSSNLRTNYAD
jgi:twitching motility protein PilI